MTNQEAIEILKIERDHMIPTLLMERIEAIDIAILALQAQDVPDTNVGDMISRQAAIDALRTCYDTETISMDNGDEYINYGDVVGGIEQLPSVQPERKTGKWLDAVLPNDNGGLPVQVCDQCNTFFPLAYTGGGHNFCPHCGADMRGEEDETD